jgi:hypothetical protein
LQQSFVQPGPHCFDCVVLQHLSQQPVCAIESPTTKIRPTTNRPAERQNPFSILKHSDPKKKVTL